MGDSTLIIEHVRARRGIDLDAHLSAPQRAQVIVVQRMLEEHYHQCFEHELFLGRGGAGRLSSYSVPLRPSSIDACIFGFLGVTIYVEGDNPLFRHAASLDSLVRYSEGMRKRYFPETLEALPAP